MLAGAMAELSVGDPSLLETDVGPVIDEDARQSIEAHIADMGRKARLVARTSFADRAAASFVAPIAFEVGRIADLRREVFGPVLHVVRFQGERLLEIVDEINALGYGLTLGLHTRIDETMHAVARRARVGNIYINRNQIGAVVGVQPFGGEALSGTGPKAGGPHYLDALTRAPESSGDRVEIVDARVDQALEAALGRAAAAQAQWAAVPDRAASLERASASASGEARAILEEAAAIAARFSEAQTLPGPHGQIKHLAHETARAGSLSWTRRIRRTDRPRARRRECGNRRSRPRR